MAKKIKLIRFDEGGIEEDGKRQEIVLDSITHLGRAKEVEDYHVRETPEDFRDAKIAVSIAGCPYISRNHTLIYPSDGEGSVLIEDLNSLNGTYVRGKRIPAGEKIKLEEQDVFSLAEHVTFKYVPFWFQAEESLAPYQDGETYNYGLMVAHKGGNLGGVEADVLNLKTEFEKRGFNIETLINEEATVEKILEKLEKLSRVVTVDSIFLFYFSGHGDEEGNLRLGNWASNKKLSPSELFSVLGNFRGQKLIMLDGCYTFAADSYKLPQRSILVGSEGKAYEGECISLNRDELAINGTCMSYFSRALQKALRDNPHRVDVEKLEEIIKNEPRIKIIGQKISIDALSHIILQTRA